MRVSSLLLCLALLAGGGQMAFAVAEKPVTTPKTVKEETPGKTTTPAPPPVKPVEEAEKIILAASGEAIKVGRDYLELLVEDKEGKNRESLLAVSGSSPYMGESRKKQLDAYYVKLRDWLSSRERDENGKLRAEVISSAMEGNLAAVIFTLFDQNQPLDIGILPVLVYRDGGRWVAAPFLYNFSNTRLPLDHDVSQQQKAMAQWAENKSKELTINALKIAEDRIRDKMLKVRTDLKVNEATNRQLIGLWKKAMRMGDALTVAALGEIGNTSQSSSSIRLKQAQGYVTLEEKKLWQLRLTSLLVSEATWIVPLKGAEEKGGSIEIGVIPFKADMGNDLSTDVYSFTFSAEKRGNGDVFLEYPKEFYPKPQVEFWDNGLDEAGAKELQKRILETYLKNRSKLKFDSAVEFAQEYIKRCSDPNAGIEDYLALHDDVFFSGDDALKQLSSEWFNKTESQWRQIRNLVSRDKSKAAGSSPLKKSTQLVEADKDHTLLLLSWYWEGTVPRLMDIQSLWMEKRDGRWVWLKDRKAVKELASRVNLQERMKEFQDRILREGLNVVKPDVLPVVPDWDQKKLMEPDASLARFLKSEFSTPDALYHFIHHPRGLALDDDKDIRDRYFYDKMHYFNGMGKRDFTPFTFENKPESEGGRIILKALQLGDWGMFAVAFRRQESPFLLAYPLVKYKGEWKFLWTGSFQYSGGKIESPQRPEGESPFWTKLDDFQAKLFNQLVLKKLIPLNESSAKSETK